MSSPDGQTAEKTSVRGLQDIGMLYRPIIVKNSPKSTKIGGEKCKTVFFENNLAVEVL